MQFERNVRFKKEINLTPLIDVIFLLIVFFLLTSKFITTEVIDLNLSEIKDGEAVLVDDEAVIIMLEYGGKFTLDKQSYKIRMLRDKIKGLIINNKRKDVVIINNEGVNVQEMVAAIDQIKAAGGVNISLTQILPENSL